MEEWQSVVIGDIAFPRTITITVICADGEVIIGEVAVE